MFEKLLFITLFIFSYKSFAADVAITIDDFNFSNQVGMSPDKRNIEILNALRKNKVKAMGFVTTKYLSDPLALEGVKKWNSDGHIIGNHTENHWKYSDKSFTDFSADILVADTKLQQFPNFKKIFRFPYLKEGESAEKRDSLRNFLEKNGYKNGHVSIDASDWYVNMRLIEKIKSGKKVDFDKYKAFYLKHIWDRSQYYSQLALKTLGKEIKYTLLLHHNLITALFLDDLLKMYKEKGWNVVDANTAFEDPIYKSFPMNVPSGESLIWALAKDKGDTSLRYPAEDSRYEEKEMDELGL